MDQHVVTLVLVHAKAAVLVVAKMDAKNLAKTIVKVLVRMGAKILQNEEILVDLILLVKVIHHRFNSHTKDVLVAQMRALADVVEHASMAVMMAAGILVRHTALVDAKVDVKTLVDIHARQAVVLVVIIDFYQ